MAVDLRLAMLTMKEPPFDLAPLEPLLKHIGTRALEARLGWPVPYLISQLFDEDRAPYDSICIRAQGDEDGTYYTRNEMQMILFTYIIKRATAFLLLEAEAIIVTGLQDCKNDMAFGHFFKHLIQRDTISKSAKHIDGHGSTAMVEQPSHVKAFKVFTQKPLKFKVQEERDKFHFEVEKMAAFAFQDLEPKGRFDVEWEIMSKPLCECLYPDSDYAFREEEASS